MTRGDGEAVVGEVVQGLQRVKTLKGSARAFL